MLQTRKIKKIKKTLLILVGSIVTKKVTTISAWCQQQNEENQNPINFNQIYHTLHNLPLNC
jgi:hypothetical protein